jgi:hypothetical protein
MLRWLWRRVFGDGRRIFRYFDGRQYRWADPLVSNRALEKAGDWFTLVGSLRAERQFSADDLGPALATDTDTVIEELAGIVREAFNVKPVGTADGKPEGLTDLECLRLLGDFVAFLKDVEEAWRPLSKRPSAAPLLHSADSHTGQQSPLSLPETASVGPMP